MFDDLIFRALIAGLMIAIIAAPLGCFVLWQRLSYFGDALAHTAFFGAAIALFFHFHIFIGTISTAIITALVLSRMQYRPRMSGDSLLGIISHATLAVALLILHLPSAPRFDVMDLLQGEILLLSMQDLSLIAASGIVILGVCVLYWRKFLAMVISPDIAHAEGFASKKESLLLTLMIAVFIAIAIKLVGILMVAAILIIPAASANLLINRMHYQPFLAGFIGITAVSLGMNFAIEANLPPGPCMVVMATVIYLFSLSYHFIRQRR